MYDTDTLENIGKTIQRLLLLDLKDKYGDYIIEEEMPLSSTLSKIHRETHGEEGGFIFIIDEWDCLFREAKNSQEVHKAYLDFLKNLFKDQIYVKLVYMTGILPIKKYGTHSALNIFDEYSMTDPSPLEQYVGFTEDEVKELCERFHMNFDEIKRWYDGYRFPEALHIYNPKSVVSAMTKKKYQSYWTRTETYEALSFYINMDFDGLRSLVVRMITGEHMQCDVSMFQNDMTTFVTKDDILALLVHLGYLAYDSEQSEVFIPNEEIREEFIRAVKGNGWQEVINSIKQSMELLEATLRIDAKTVADGINAVHQEMTSILNYNNENALSCVINLAFYSARQDYTLIREYPAGKGFADVVFLPRKNSDKPAIVVELKWNQSAEGAIAQIRSRNYGVALKDYFGEVLLVGINYDKESKVHQCVIERIRR
jgi:hypothetical protein